MCQCKQKADRLPQIRSSAILVLARCKLPTTKNSVPFPIRNFILSCVIRITYIAEQAVLFCKVYNVNLNCTLVSVSHSKHKPLKLIASICIVPHPHVKLQWTSLSYLLYVSALKIPIKCDLFWKKTFRYWRKNLLYSISLQVLFFRLHKCDSASICRFIK